MATAPIGISKLSCIPFERIVTACEQNYIDYWACAGAPPYAEFSDEGGITRAITGLPNEIFNVVLRCTLGESEVKAKIDAAIEDFGRRRIPMIWHVGKLTSPRNLGEYLEARGYPHDYDLRAMAVDLEQLGESNPGPTKTEIREVVRGEQSADWIRCIVSSWHLSREIRDWMARNPCFNVVVPGSERLSSTRKMYLGYLSGSPVSASMLFWKDGIAGLQAVGTLPSAQRRGAGSAMIKAVLKDARLMGFKTVVVLSTVEGVRLYEKAGFRTFGKLPEHLMRFDK